MSIEGALPVRRGDAVTVRLTLPEGGALTAAASVVRAGRSVTALRIEGLEEGDRDRLESYVFAAVASGESSKPS